VLTESVDLPINAVADAVLDRLAPEAGYDDDVAMVVYRHQLAPLRIEVEATPDQLAPIRRQLTSWLQAAAVGEVLASDIVLVVSEACTNCIEHAYVGHDVGAIILEMEAVNDEVRSRITDSGSWRTPTENVGNRGRGLLLMRAMSELMEVEIRPDGTTIDLVFRVATAEGD
jgi:anti-sigma regulatory factor (Ser/Thr protein kinase)